MSEVIPSAFEIDPLFEAKLSQFESGLLRGFMKMGNEYGNSKYQASIQDPKNPDELGRIHISSITQYAPDGDVNEAGEFDTNAGSADFHYGADGDYGSGVVIFKKQEDGSLVWEIESDLADKEEIFKLVSDVVGAN